MKRILSLWMFLLCLVGNIQAGEEIFILNTEEGIESLGIVLPAAGKGTKVEDMTKGIVSIAATTAVGKTDTRIFQGT